MSRIRDLHERESILKAMLKELKQWLENGFDPFFSVAEKGLAAQIAEKKVEIITRDRRLIQRIFDNLKYVMKE